MGSLAPRDVVAREIDAELKRAGSRCVFLDMTHLDGDYVVQRFPAIHARCMKYGIDMRERPIPVVTDFSDWQRIGCKKACQDCHMPSRGSVPVASPAKQPVRASAEPPHWSRWFRLVGIDQRLHDFHT